MATARTRLKGVTTAKCTNETIHAKDHEHEKHRITQPINITEAAQHEKVSATPKGGTPGAPDHEGPRDRDVPDKGLSRDGHLICVGTGMRGISEAWRHSHGPHP